MLVDGTRATLVFVVVVDVDDDDDVDDERELCNDVAVRNTSGAVYLQKINEMMRKHERNSIYKSVPHGVVIG